MSKPLRLLMLVMLLGLACLHGCSAPAPEVPPMETRAAENVPPEMLDRALKSLHSGDAQQQLTGLKFLESFPEVKQQHTARIEELKQSSKDARVRSQAEKLLK
ncbi:MAG: hypothetical protein SFV81_14965 [Pirellulaceae bacterium]|nr:hypothetical protein [Pirellulaceae bacterium]